MKFTIAGGRYAGNLVWYLDGLRDVLIRHGHTYVDDEEQAGLVFNVFAADRPRPFRRRAQAVFVVAVTEIESFSEPLRQGYPLLVRSLANLGMVLTRGRPQPEVHLLTLEQGHYTVNGDRSEADYFEAVYRRVEPLASSRLVIDNIFQPDLERALWEGDEISASITRTSRRLDALKLLPAPVPLQEILSPRDFRHVQRLYGIGGLSYGNMSARKDDRRFWMSGSGVDKSNLVEIGRDILMVKGYDRERNAMLISHPAPVQPRRVSVDAIEHWTIYQEHPDVGAILHVHAWLQDAPATPMNYPCGTYELAQAVADLVSTAPEPGRAVVGQRNHGLTITGQSLDEILDRVGDQLLPQVPMS